MNDNKSQAAMPRESWQRLSELLSARDELHGLKRVFPPHVISQSVLESLGSAQIASSKQEQSLGTQLREKLDGLIGQLSLFERVSHCPIVAITGLLNAGKSSLLATYLSEEGRSRVLRGVGNQQGTHRFVIWLPQVWWSDAELLSTMISFMTSIFGHPPELLSESPELAQEQYNGRILKNALMASEQSDVVVSNQGASIDPLAVPLIAGDRGLDDLKLGLVDCPDIQTGFFEHASSGLQGSELAAARRDQLSRIGRLCSAFVVVSKLSSLHDASLLQLLTTLRDAMPGVPRILAINKVKARYTLDVVNDEARTLVDRFGMASVFAAYDYRSALVEDKILPAPEGLLHTESQPQPIFVDVAGFSKSRTLEKASPEKTAMPSVYLYHLSSRLESGNLVRESRRSLLLQLQNSASQAVEWVARNEQQRSKRTVAAWKSIADACYDFMAERNAEGVPTGLRLQASPAIVAQLADSLQRTAPTWMRLSMTIDRTARQFQQAVSNSASRFKVLQSASNSVMQFAKSFRRGEGAQVVTPQRLADAIRKHDFPDAMQAVTEEQLVGGCEQAMKRFAAEDKSTLDAEELDAWSKQIWDNMPLKQKLWKGTQPLALLMGPLLAAVLVPIDGGGTAVLVFASAKELLAAAGIAALLSPTLGGQEAVKIVHRETPWRQLSDLFAIVCDSLQVPRPSEKQLPSSNCAGETRSLLPCSLPVKMPSSSVVGEVHSFSQWQMTDEFTRSLRSAIQNCS